MPRQEISSATRRNYRQGKGVSGETILFSHGQMELDNFALLIFAAFPITVVSTGMNKWA